MGHTELSSSNGRDTGVHPQSVFLFEAGAGATIDEPPRASLLFDLTKPASPPRPLLSLCSSGNIVLVPTHTSKMVRGEDMWPFTLSTAPFSASYCIIHT